MISITRDLTTQYNANNVVQIDVSDYDYVLVHFIGLSSTITFYGSLDGGDITGQTTASPASATNWTPVLAENQATKTTAATATTGSLFKFVVTATYLKLLGTANITKLLVSFAKIS